MLLNSLEAVIFDMDGTLFDSERLSLAATNFGFTKILGRELTDDENQQLIGRPIKKILAEWFPEDHRDIYKTGRKYYYDRMKEVRAYPGIIDLLNSLRERKLRMALVTSSPCSDAKALLSLSGISEFFEFSIGQEDTQYQKPDPAPLVMAMKRLGLEPEKCIYIGDQPYDIIAANGAGIKSIGVIWGPGRRELLEPFHPHAILTNPGEVLPLLEAL